MNGTKNKCSFGTRTNAFHQQNITANTPYHWTIVDIHSRSVFVNLNADEVSCAKNNSPFLPVFYKCSGP